MSDSVLDRQAEWLERYRPGVRISEQGAVAAVGDGITWITGLPSAAMDDIVVFECGSRGMVFDLSESMIGAVSLHEVDVLSAGCRVELSARTLSIPVGDDLLGRVIDPWGIPLDGQPPPRAAAWQPLEIPSPAIVERGFVTKPLYTGSRIIDTLIPIGKGQRQLIIGDEGLGRSSIALDTVIHQRGKDVHCVYVLIGQKRSTVVNTIDLLREYGALEYTTIVAAEASGLPGLQFLAPFAGCAIAEHWMRQGRDTLVVYDDLSTHAKIYRELSLLIRRPPGREAYPGDIFSVHARLLERSTCLNAEHGGGSMTALPIVETMQGEIAAYIPTNLISITDGQIYLDQALFSGGFRPAIDVRRSVSRIGGKAQHSRVRDEAGRMKLDYLQFLELEVFSRFGARLEASMEKAIGRGNVLREILKQDRLKPIPVECHMAWMIAFNDGLLDELAPDSIPSIIDRIEQEALKSPLGLDDPRELWARALSGWVETAATESAA